MCIVCLLLRSIRNTDSDHFAYTYVCRSSNCMTVLCTLCAGEYLLTGDQEGVLKTWETGSGRVVHEFDTGCFC